MADTLLTVQDLTVIFSRRGWLGRANWRLAAVDRVSLEIGASETLGLVGESGSGKTTLGRAILRLTSVQSGGISYRGQDVLALRGRELNHYRKEVQAIFQDPYSSLNPSMPVGDILAEPMQIHLRLGAKERDRRTANLLEQVGLAHGTSEKFPHELSGGQRQRVAIARALAMEPRLLICDEPLSALDVSTQSQIVNLLQELQERLELSYLFISHNLGIVRHMSHRIAVMYRGRLVEEGPRERIYGSPGHPYTSALLAAVAVPNPRLQRERRERRRSLSLVVEGEFASHGGCHYRDRCPFAMDVCRDETPELERMLGGGAAACHLHILGPRLLGRSVNELTPEVQPSPAISRYAMRREGDK